MKRLARCAGCLALGMASFAAIAAAQDPADAPTYFAATLSPVGGMAPLALPAELGRPGWGVGIDLTYSYATLSASRHLPVHTVGGGVELTLLAAHLSVSGMGAYAIPDCGIATHCDGYPMVGASGVLRIGSWSVSDQLTEGVGTLSLRAQAGLGFPHGGRAESGAAGLSTALIGRSGSLRVSIVASPQVVWGRLRVDNAGEFGRQFGSMLVLGDSTFEQSGVRFMVGGSIGITSVRTGLGLQVGVQHVVVHGARARVGVGLTLRTR